MGAVTFRACVPAFAPGVVGVLVAGTFFTLPRLELRSRLRCSSCCGLRERGTSVGRSPRHSRWKRWLAQAWRSSGEDAAPAGVWSLLRSRLSKSAASEHPNDDDELDRRLRGWSPGEGWPAWVGPPCGICWRRDAAVLGRKRDMLGAERWAVSGDVILEDGSTFLERETWNLGDARPLAADLEVERGREGERSGDEGGPPLAVAAEEAEEEGMCARERRLVGLLVSLKRRWGVRGEWRCVTEVISPSLPFKRSVPE